VAIYRDAPGAGSSKLSLHSPDADVAWSDIAYRIDKGLGLRADYDVVGRNHCIFVVDADPESARAWVQAELTELHLMSAGKSVELLKDALPPAQFVARFALDSRGGSHALGHARLATESQVTTAGSHPFWSGSDLCLVHNGSLSNHNGLRRTLRRAGISFATETDSEVAAGYVAWRLREGASLVEALEGCLEDIDGFYTFAVSSADGLALLCDPIGCKPAVVAETDDWIAMASEYRALAVLPGAADATVWEPEPGRVYRWDRAAAPALLEIREPAGSTC
jgi:amidophosphoribosyltransferase